MSVGLTVYPLAEKSYEGARASTRHSLYFRVQCPSLLAAEVNMLPGRETGRLLADYVNDARNRYVVGVAGMPLRAINAHALADVLAKWAVEDHQRQSHAVVAFLRALPSSAEAVPCFSP